MADWVKIAAGVMCLGFLLDTLAIATNNGLVGEKNAVEAMEVCGFICFMVACMLAFLGVFGNMKGNRGATIAMVVFAFLAGLFIIIGLAIYGARVNNRNLPVYSTTLLVCGAAMAILGGIFGALSIARQ